MLHLSWQTESLHRLSSCCPHSSSFSSLRHRGGFPAAGSLLRTWKRVLSRVHVPSQGHSTHQCRLGIGRLGTVRRGAVKFPRDQTTSDSVDPMDAKSAMLRHAARSLEAGAVRGGGTVETVLLPSGLLLPCCCPVVFSAVLSAPSSTVAGYSGCSLSLSFSFRASGGAGGVDCGVDRRVAS